MTMQDIVTIIGALGFPIALVMALLLIFKKDLFPWFVEDQKQRRSQDEARHAEYLKTYSRSTMAIEILSKAFIEFTVLVKAQDEVMKSTNEILIGAVERNHMNLVERLNRIDSKFPPT